MRIMNIKLEVHTYANDDKDVHKTGERKIL